MQRLPALRSLKRGATPQKRSAHHSKLNDLVTRPACDAVDAQDKLNDMCPDCRAYSTANTPCKGASGMWRLFVTVAFDAVVKEASTGTVDSLRELERLCDLRERARLFLEKVLALDMAFRSCDERLEAFSDMLDRTCSLLILHAMGVHVDQPKEASHGRHTIPVNVYRKESVRVSNGIVDRKATSPLCTISHLPKCCGSGFVRKRKHSEVTGVQTVENKRPPSSDSAFNSFSRDRIYQGTLSYGECICFKACAGTKNWLSKIPTRISSLVCNLSMQSHRRPFTNTKARSRLHESPCPEVLVIRYKKLTSINSNLNAFLKNYLHSHQNMDNMNVQFLLYTLPMKSEEGLDYFKALQHTVSVLNKEQLRTATWRTMRSIDFYAENIKQVISLDQVRSDISFSKPASNKHLTFCARNTVALSRDDTLRRIFCFLNRRTDEASPVELFAQLFGDYAGKNSLDRSLMNAEREMDAKRFLPSARLLQSSNPCRDVVLDLQKEIADVFVDVFSAPFVQRTIHTLLAVLVECNSNSENAESDKRREPVDQLVLSFVLCRIKRSFQERSARRDGL
ncbi:hypothetical protein CYMTET_55077 [Cymbomonas tetramitiformis]|uniref:Uncharacterized protein n=1 Tax=Cymbomonas tetramitiformis TaxID=36881 RepID=A0AAE0BDQ4_9CHLO|nr:hypothetical protein CYMTET_55077 [Cymbomonas tetramitiformis]|eukprot:gene326-593_t